MVSEKIYSIVIFCISLTLYTVNLSFAQDNVLKQDYIAVGITEKSRFFPGAANPQLPIDSKPAAQAVVQHFTSTKGIEINTEKIKVKTEPSAKDIELNEKILKKSAEDLLKSNTKLEPLPNCTKNETLKFQTANTLPAGKEIFLFDILYLRKSELPLDPELVYGPGVEIMVYDHSKMTPENAAIRGAMIPCLPFRMRGTSSYIFRDYGVNALKDYSADPNGNGILHETARTKTNSR